MAGEFDGRVAVITGAASGIGRATALRLAQAGARVFGGDLRIEPANVAELAAAGVTLLACDVRQAPQIRNLVDTALASTGGLDLVVSNAGINLVAQLPEVTEAGWDDCIDTNLKAAFLLCKYTIGPLRDRGGGAVVFTSSNAGLLPRAHDPVYGTSKAALNALARNLALCHARDRIRFNTVCPGPVGATRMIDDVLATADDRSGTFKAFRDASPLAKANDRLITPDEVAQSIVYLLSDAAAMVTGTALRIDGGKSLGVPPSD